MIPMENASSNRVIKELFMMTNPELPKANSPRHLKLSVVKYNGEAFADIRLFKEVHPSKFWIHPTANGIRFSKSDLTLLKSIFGTRFLNTMRSYVILNFSPSEIRLNSTTFLVIKKSTLYSDVPYVDIRIYRSKNNVLTPTAKGFMLTVSDINRLEMRFQTEDLLDVLIKEL
jgi:hypothetical protein